MTGGFRFTALLALAIVTAAVIYASSRDSAAQTNGPPFAPGGLACLEKFDAVDIKAGLNIGANECDGDPAPGVSTDVRGKFCTGWDNTCSVKDANPIDSNFGSTAAFVPKTFEVPTGSSVPIGALVGRLGSNAVLGLINGHCNSSIDVHFTLQNASTNVNDTIAPKPVGETDTMKPLARDADGNGIPDGIDKYPKFLTAAFDVDFDNGPDRIPFTADDVNGPAAPLQPRARLGGFSKVQGNWISLHFLLFEPGITVKGPEGTPITLNPDLGYPSITVLQDPTVPPAPSAISDFCSPLRVSNVAFGLTRDNPCTGSLAAGKNANCPFTDPPEVPDTKAQNLGYPFFPCESNNNVDEDNDGVVNDGCPQVNAAPDGNCTDDISDDGEDSSINDGCPKVGAASEGDPVPATGCSGTQEGGCLFRKNPATAGDYKAVVATGSQRDADGDGIENTLDVCSLKPNGTWNPRAAGVASNPAHTDTDSDGISDVCDPFPNAQSGGVNAGCKAGYVGLDEDQDCFSNRADNCPLANQLQDPTKNPDQFTNVPVLFDNEPDGIGNTCDVTSCGTGFAGYTQANCELFGVSTNGPDKRDGGYTIMCLNLFLTFGVGASTAPVPPVIDTNPACAVALAVGQTPTPEPTKPPAIVTPAPGQTTGTTVQCVGANCVGDTGIGSLAPTGTGLPAWAALLVAFGGAGVVAGLGLAGSRLMGRKK